MTDADQRRARPMAELNSAAQTVLAELRRAADGDYCDKDERGRWFGVYLKRASPPEMSQAQFAAHLGALRRAGFYRPLARGYGSVFDDGEFIDPPPHIQPRRRVIYDDATHGRVVAVVKRINFGGTATVELTWPLSDDGKCYMKEKYLAIGRNIPFEDLQETNVVPEPGWPP